MELWDTAGDNTSCFILLSLNILCSDTVTLSLPQTLSQVDQSLKNIAHPEVFSYGSIIFNPDKMMILNSFIFIFVYV